MTATVTEGQMEWQGQTTWFKTVGSLEPPSAQAPIVLLHGGPGAPHDYLEPLEVLAGSGRTTVFYDQLGCGRSEHLPDAPPEFWTVDLFAQELRELVRHLGIGQYHLLGQSWGGMLAMVHALEHPAGLLSIAVCDSPASVPLWVEETNRLRAELPPDLQEILREHERAGTTSDPEYEQGMEVFYRRHVCRLDPWPDCLARTFAALAEDPTVYHTMFGPSEFHCTGSLQTWDITNRLAEIDVPTLLISGRHDEATPRIVQEINERIPNSRWMLFENSSHTPHLEEPDAFVEALDQFLADVEAGAARRAARGVEDGTKEPSPTP